MRDAVEANLAAALPQAEQRFEELGTAGAHQSGEAQDLARPHAEAGVLGVACSAEMGHLEGGRVGRDGHARRVQGEQVAPDHQARHIYLLELRGRSRRDALAVAQDRDDVGNRLNLLQSVRNVENRDARGLEFADATQQRRGLDLSEGRARLVEDDDSARRRQGASNLRQLPMCDREFLHGRRHRDLDAEGAHRFLGAAVHRLVVEGQASRDFVAEEHVLSDGQIRGEHNLLMDQDDPAPLGVDRPLENQRRAIEFEGAASRAEVAAEDFHQRGLSGAVFSDDRVDLARPEREIDVGKDLDRTERAGQSHDLEQNLRRCRLAGRTVVRSRHFLPPFFSQIRRGGRSWPLAC